MSRPMRRQASRICPRCLRVFLLGLLLLAGRSGLAAPEGRFDVQEFRPWAGPQDLVMVAQTRPLSHLSVAAGGYLHFTLDPLSLVNLVSGQRLVKAVSNRLELDVMAGIGLWDWAELGLILPIVTFQSSGNLEAIGREGFIRASVLGDLRLTSKIAIPGLRRRPEAKGFGLSALLQLSLPTGSSTNFASDGAVTAQPGLAFDYRFKNGALVGLNAGVWVRPTVQFLDIKLGSSFAYALAGEMPIVRRWGLTVVGNVYGNIPLAPPPKSIQENSFEFLLGLRWYSSSSLTITVGGGGGDCGIGSPAFRFFTSVVWVPPRSREWGALERFKKPPNNPDPDNDGLIGEHDFCPSRPGPVQNHGCPDEDHDKDGIIDRLDRCPDDAARPGSRDGCPLAFIKGNKIAIIEQVHFATDQDIILPESFPILKEVAGVIKAHTEIERVLVEGHTDIRANARYNKDLSNRRAQSVMRFLLNEGIETGRLRAEGFGQTRPLADNNTEGGMALNRRVEFTIEKWVGLPPGQLPKVPPKSTTVLPTQQKGLPETPKKTMVLPTREGALPAMPSTLPKIGPENPRPGQRFPVVHP
ncbi:MAG TPA: OmpA family protein [Polyangia bacterium]|nr:OmpA family protein [Polyangia bacterium]